MRQSQATAVCPRWVRALVTAAAIGGALALTSAAWAANAWSGPTTIDNPNPPEYIACPSSTFCVAVGTNGYAQTFNGTSWGTPQFIDPSLNLSGSPLTSISCSSSSFCAAVDLAGYALTFNGSSWTPRAQIDTTENGVTAVGCASASFCVAGDAGGNGFVYNGTSWSGPITVNHTSNHEGIGGIACPATSFCVAVGEAGSVETSTDGGTTWTTPPDIIGSNDLTSVSCPSATFCVAVDTAGNAYTYNGGTWSAADPIDTTNGQFGGGSLDSVSCPSSSFCAAMDGFENVLMFNGSTWTAPQQLETGASLHPGVSCASSSFCAAVDGGGNAFLYGTVSSSAPPPPPPPPATVAPPVLGKAVDASPISGVVSVKPPPGKSLGAAGDTAALSKGQGFVALTEARQIPTGSEIDALQGSLRIVSATGKVGKTQTATLAGGIFKVTQVRTGITKGLTDFKLVESAFTGAPGYGLCKPKHKATDATVAKLSTRTLQLLKVSGHGKFRTIGRYSSATVRGTIWTVADRCDGTLTHVIRDTVLVDDFVRHKTILLHAGQSYLARAPTEGK
jgi:hypothetical protein